MNKSRYKEITMNLLLCLSVGCRTIVCLWMQPMATTVSLRLKKDETPIVLYSPTTNSSVYYVKKTENADLKSGDADIVNN